ncbi:putative isoflavone reductase family protein [Phaeoacremonium minimum UCRPA7]|uniref:Putative isoflavone reductase family protein n=1 Tax=Phaeoacremonium minimum (strain UCR-PA7) TaxID=1286976 RepID=R8BXT3_PHAM7|nr:putative isoflavone reductase family protein [Phaeoacremonium minimum UCRPA7]EOO04211.1 putative isoflavone reductase family protein [Phaeoacremonium minimum UCRPA7]
MATFRPSHILLFGATGKIGKFITEAVINAKPSFDHLAIFTSPSTVANKPDLLNKWKSEGVSVIVGDVDKDEDVRAAYDGVDTVVSAVGREAIDKQIRLIRLAEESGSVKWFFPSEYGTDIEYGPQSPDEKPHQKKLAVRKFIRENVQHLKITYLVTGPYFDMWAHTTAGAEEAGGFDVRHKEADLVEDGEGKIGFTTMADVGKLLVAALQHPGASFNQALKVQSFVVTPNQVVAEYEKQTGTKWKVSYTSLDRIRELEAELWARGKPQATSVTLQRIWAEGGTLYEKSDNEKIGVKSEDLDSLAVAVRRDIEDQQA